MVSVFKYEVDAVDLIKCNYLYINGKQKDEYNSMYQQNKFIKQYEMVTGHRNPITTCCSKSKTYQYLYWFKNCHTINNLWSKYFDYELRSNLKIKDCIHNCPTWCTKKIIVSVEFEEVVKDYKAILKNKQILITYSTKSLINICVNFVKINEKLFEQTDINSLNKDIRKFFQ